MKKSSNTVPTSENDSLLRLLRLFLYLVLLCLLVCGFFVVSKPIEFFLFMTGIISFVIMSSPIFLRQDYNIIEPPTFIVGLLLIGFPMKMLYMIAYQWDTPTVYQKLLLGSHLDILLLGALAIFAGTCALTLGYSLGRPRFNLDRLSLIHVTEWEPQRLQPLIILILIISLSASFLFVTTTNIQIQSLQDLSAKRFLDLEGGTSSRLNSLSYYLYRLAAICKYAFYLLLVWYLRGKSRLRSMMGFLMLLSGLFSIFIPFFINNRGGIFLIIVDAIILIYLLKKRLNLSMMVSSLTVAMGLSFVASVFRSRREQDVLEIIFGQRHFLDVSKISHIVNIFPSRIDYLYGETLIGWIFAPVPRILWPNKPISNEIGQFIGYNVFGLSGSGVPPTLLGEFYINFGWIGVLLGMFLFGLLCRTMYETFSEYADKPNMVLIYGLVTTRFFVFVVNNSFGIGMLKTLVDVVPLLLLLWYISSSPESLSIRIGWSPIQYQKPKRYLPFVIVSVIIVLTNTAQQVAVIAQ